MKIHITWRWNRRENASAFYASQLGRYEQNKFMKKYSALILVALFYGFTTIPEVRLKSDGSIFHGDEAITIYELKEYNYSEIRLIVDYDVSYDKFIDLMGQLEKIGIRKVGIVSNTDGRSDKAEKEPQKND